MLGIEAAVPVDFGVIEAKFATCLLDFHIHVRVTGKVLVAKGSVFILFADIVRFVDYRADGGVFVEEDGGDQVLVREILIAEIQMGFEMTNFVSLLFLHSGITDAPTWPTMLNPVGSSSCSVSGSMALIMSSGGSEPSPFRYDHLRFARTYGSSSSRSSTRDYTARG